MPTTRPASPPPRCQISWCARRDTHALRHHAGPNRDRTFWCHRSAPLQVPGVGTVEPDGTVGPLEIAAATPSGWVPMVRCGCRRCGLR